MLKEMAWLNYAKEIMTEYKQCLDEGKDVEAFYDECRTLSVDQE